MNTSASLLTFLLGLSLLLSPAPASADHATCAGVGLLNPGFEDGHLDADPECWTVDQPVADAAVVVDTETSAEFQAYGGQTGVGSVQPFDGSLMLRLGTPNRKNEAQDPKPDRVSQTFTPVGSSLRFAFRLFSWEHRGLDQFSFDLQDALGATVSGTTLSSGPDGALQPGLAIPDAGPEASCAALPCSFAIDVGSRQDFLDSDWTVVQIDDIPTSGLPGDGMLTLTYEAGGTDNNAIPTWSYFDAAPSDPTSQFDLTFPRVDGAGFIFDPGNPAAIEGSVVQFIDVSSDPDGDIVAWHWHITGPNGFDVESFDQFPILVPAQEGQYAISLAVEDSTGGTSTASSGDTVSGFTMPFLNVENAAPIVDALNMETLADTVLELEGLYLDGGWLDLHSAEFDVAALTPTAASIAAVSEPALGSGIVTATVDIPIGASGTFSGELTVADLVGDENSAPTGDEGSDTFEITVIDEGSTPREPNNVLDDAIPLDSDGSYLSWLQGADDRDFFELKWTGDQPIPANSELLVSLAPPAGADYDLALVAINPETQALGQQFVGQQFVGQQFVGQQFVGQQFVGQQFVGQQFVGQQFVGQQFVGQQFVGQQFVGQQFVDAGNAPLFPGYEINGLQLNALSQIAALDGSTVGSADITIDELDLNLPPGVAVLGFAANSGDAEERLLVSITDPGMSVFAVVIREGNPATTEPYRLTVRASTDVLSLASAAGVPVSTLNAELLGLDDLEAACQADPLVGPGSATVATAVLHTFSGANPSTVFVTQLERLYALYDDAEVDAMVASLVALAENGKIQGDIISVPSVIYDGWDANPCDVQTANATAAAIRAELMPYLNDPAVENIVIIGNDNIVPFRRVADTTVVGNERNYALGTYLVPGSPLFHAVDGGYILTQDYYADRVFTPYEAGALYVPDVAIGRLVETPLEITAVANAFGSSNGTLSVETASVAGYDFFSDHANAVVSELSTAGRDVDSLVGPNWTADDLRCTWGLDVAGGCAPAPDLSDQSAHYTHWAALSAGGYFNADYDDYVTTSEVATTGLDDSFLGHLGFTIGCHAGFSAPDENVLATGLPFDPSLDFAQAMAQARAVWVASTGYAIGDDEALAYTELLMLNYTQQLLGGGNTAGSALVNAKLLYLGSLGTITNYDQKVSIEMTLYGLPQYEIDLPSNQVVSQIETTIRTLAIHELEPGPGVTQIETVDFFPSLVDVVTADGTFQTANGDSESVVARPRMPRIVSELGDAPGLDVHGAIMVSGTYERKTDPGVDHLDPLIAAPLTEWGLTPDEPQVCLPIFWPSPVKLNGIGDDRGISQRLIVYTAAFRCDTEPGETVTGEYRAFTEQNVRVYRSASEDFAPPRIGGVQLIEGASGDGILISVNATDLESGIGEVIAVRYRDGVVSSASLVLEDEPGPLPTTGTFVVEFDDFLADDEFVVHVIDGAGNVATDSAKGNLIQFIDVDAGPDQFVSAGVPVTFSGTVFEFGLNAENDGLTAPVQFQWSFGDGTLFEGELSETSPDVTNFNLAADGTATFDVTHQYSPDVSGPLQATLFVVDGSGLTGIDGASIYVCGDPLDVVVDPSVGFPAEKADLIGCGVDVAGDSMSITLFTAGDLETGTGNIAYRLRVGLTTQSNSKQLSYHDGTANGLKSLDVSIVDNSVTFTFNLKDLGKKRRNADAAVVFSAETRAGVPSTGSAGLVDELPDGGATIVFPAGG